VTSNAALLAVMRKSNAGYVIPSEDEWYKAAYYDPNKPCGPGYWDYATRSDVEPSNLLSATGTNNANYAISSDYTIGSPYFRTEAGAFASSPSAYDTFDQNGNVAELNETIMLSRRGIRGGSFGGPECDMRAANRAEGVGCADESSGVGFRLVLVPEPGSAFLLLGAILASPGSRRKQARHLDRRQSRAQGLSSGRP
jgi:formylglycine-generating enzyme required for sulfatase activity